MSSKVYRNVVSGTPSSVRQGVEGIVDEVLLDPVKPTRIVNRDGDVEVHYDLGCGRVNFSIRDKLRGSGGKKGIVLVAEVVNKRSEGMELTNNLFDALSHEYGQPSNGDIKYQGILFPRNQVTRVAK